MGKFFTLLKASLTEGMSLFKVRTRKTGKEKSGAGLVVGLSALIAFSVGFYVLGILEGLNGTGRESSLLAVFVLAATLLTVIEGIYKSESLLFNCKDDDLLLSLPISRREIIWLRLLKFYLFELAYNSLFLAPMMVVYAIRVPVEPTFYLVSFVTLVLMPIIPILFSCLVGTAIACFSARFKKNNFVKVLLSFLMIMLIMAASFGLSFMSHTHEGLEVLGNIYAEVGERVAQFYYPAGAYMKLATDFKIGELLVFVLINIVVTVLVVILISLVYFKVNSRLKISQNVKRKVEAKEFKARRPVFALMRKELNRFFGSTVFVTNAGFGLIMFLVGIGAICWKFNDLERLFSEDSAITFAEVKAMLPVGVYLWMSFMTLMTFITGAMISLEGKRINILKTLPVRATTILEAKVFAALTIILPPVLIGDLVAAIWFKFGIVETALLLLGSITIPSAMQIWGILVDLKNPMLDAENDAEVVKQSRNTLVLTVSAFAMVGVTMGIAGVMFLFKMSKILILGSITGIFVVLLFILVLRLRKKAGEWFGRISG